MITVTRQSDNNVRHDKNVILSDIDAHEQKVINAYNTAYNAVIEAAASLKTADSAINTAPPN